MSYCSDTLKEIFLEPPDGGARVAIWDVCVFRTARCKLLLVLKYKSFGVFASRRAYDRLTLAQCAYRRQGIFECHGLSGAGVFSLSHKLAQLFPNAVMLAGVVCSSSPRGPEARNAHAMHPLTASHTPGQLYVAVYIHGRD